jgi:hypothetical protein
MSAERGIERPTGLAPGSRLGDYVLGEPLWRLRIAEAYQARGPAGAATLYVIDAAAAQNAEVRNEIVAGTRAAAALPEHPNIVRTVAAGLTGDILWIATEDVDGTCVRDVLRKKAMTAQRGLGAPGAGLVVLSAASALAQLTHGALAAESVVAGRSGRPRVADLAMARGVLAAARLGLISGEGLAPEAKSSPPSPAADVYALGGLIYETLVGKPLERGGPRPSEVVPGLSEQLDEVVARCCHREPARRFGNVETLREVVGDLLGKSEGAAPPPTGAALGKGSGIMSLSPGSSGSGLFAVPSLAHTLSHGGERATPVAVDASLAMALSDSAEKWLVSKGQLDYGPFSLADVVAQIEEGKIVGNHVIVDKDTGARAEVGQHPLLGPISDAARARLDEARRVAAETAHRRTENKRGVMLYVLIAVAVIAVGGGAWWGIKRARNDETTSVAAVTGVGNATIDINVSAPKRPARVPRGNRPGTGRTNTATSSGGEDMALDFSGSEDDDATETLDLETIHKVYSRQGAPLGRCLSSNGGGSANISFIIDGPSGRITVVRVNGKTSGGLVSCIAKVMKSLSFPTINGPRTRAEFDISM